MSQFETQAESSRAWIVLGLITDLGALNKISMLWLGAGIAVAFMLPNRAVFRTKAPWIAGAIMAYIFLPFVIWNLTHDFTHLEFIRNASGEEYALQNPLTFVAGLVLLMNPLAVPMWVGGFWLLLTRQEHRILGISVAVVLAILTANMHSRPEYFVAVMTAL